MIWLSVAQAGWALQVEMGSPPPDALASTERRLEHCPARQQQWVARFDKGELARLGPVAGSGELRSEDEIEACLRAGLRASPLPDGSMVRLVYLNPTAQIWESQVAGIVTRLVGEQEEGCVRLRWVVGPDGTISAPIVVEGGHEELLAAVVAYDNPLPYVPDSLREHYGDAVIVCVGQP